MILYKNYVKSFVVLFICIYTFYFFTVRKIWLYKAIDIEGYAILDDQRLGHGLFRAWYNYESMETYMVRIINNYISYF
jgi:hypothetical protein